MFRRRHPEDGDGSVQPGEPGIKETLGPEMTVVGRGARVEGTLVSTESIRVDGQVKGKIAARCDVILSSHSHVEADIRAQNVVSGGTLKGSITARTRTEVAEGAAQLRTEMAGLRTELRGEMSELRAEMHVGFADIRIAPKDASREFIRHWAPGRGVEDYIASATIEAVKPAN